MPPQLATELVALIIRSSLPRERFSTFPERASILRTYALVSPLWRSLAQAELFACPVLNHTEAMEAYRGILSEQPWRAEGVRSLRVVDQAELGVDRWLLGRLLGACKGVRRLFIRNSRMVLLSCLVKLPRAPFELLSLVGSADLVCSQQISRCSSCTAALRPLAPPLRLRLYYRGSSTSPSASPRSRTPSRFSTSFRPPPFPHYVPSDSHPSYAQQRNVSSPLPSSPSPPSSTRSPSNSPTRTPPGPRS